MHIVKKIDKRITSKIEINLWRILNKWFSRCLIIKTAQTVLLWMYLDSFGKLCTNINVFFKAILGIIKLGTKGIKVYFNLNLPLWIFSNECTIVNVLFTVFGIGIGMNTIIESYTPSILLSIQKNSENNCIKWYWELQLSMFSYYFY